MSVDTLIGRVAAVLERAGHSKVEALALAEQSVMGDSAKAAEHGHGPEACVRQPSPTSALQRLFSEIWKKIEAAKRSIYGKYTHDSLKRDLNEIHALCRPFWDELTEKPLVASSEITNRCKHGVWAADRCEDCSSEISVVDDEAVIEILRPYLHFGTSGWRRVAEKCLEALRPYLTQPVRESVDQAFLAGLAAGRPNDLAKVLEALKNLTKYVQEQAAENNLEWALLAKNQVLVNALKAINSIEDGSAND